METFAGPSFHSARWPDDSTSPARASRWSAPAPAGSRSRRRSRTEVEQLTIYQRTAQWMLPNPLYHAKVPAGDRWALRHLPVLRTLVPVHHDLSRHRVRRPSRTGSIRTSDASDGIVDQRAQRAAAPQLTAWITIAPPGPTRPHREVDPRLPGDGQADPPGRRLLAAYAQQAERRAGPHRHRAHRPRRRRDRRRTHHAADVICYATGFRHNDFLALDGRHRPRRRVAARAVGRRADGVPRHHDPRTSPTCSASTARGRTWRHGASLFFHSEYQIHHAMDCDPPGRCVRCAPIEVRARGARRLRRAVPGARSASSCGPTRRSSTATTRTRRARSTRSRPGRWTCTGSGRDRPTPSSTSSAERRRRFCVR